ncbi:PI-PLC X domain-containing protein 1 [Acomys russatus]|uniref:PI-PLC X domain-containing protein 1 n=1 Tax=Acomys russatus TaxID=60746 RepID=UPI0021E243A5|nr:PI-PLC X domain-containing protein 1 [Acomys russatus]
MTYSLTRKSQISRERSRLLRLLGQVAPCVTGPAVLRWGVTQTRDVTQQLDAGARYLDLSVALAPGGSDQNLRFEHVTYSTALVEDTLTEVAEWLESHPREVVILDFRGFAGMTHMLHDHLVGALANIFEGAICPRAEAPTLRQLWARAQQVIVMYAEEAAVQRHAMLWPGASHWETIAANTQGLLGYLEDMKGQGRPGSLFVADATLTPDSWYALAHPVGSREKMALQGLPALTAWVRAQRPGPEPGCTNIIACDFIGSGASFARDIIALNQKLLLPPP